MLPSSAMKTVCTISILLNLAFLFIGLSHRLPAEKQLPSWHWKVNPLWKQRATLFHVLPKDSGSVVFLGDSQTDNTEPSELFNLPIKNRGIGGDNLEGILNRLSDITDIKPSKLFLLVGTNDVELGTPLDSMRLEYQSIIDSVRINSPKTVMYVESILPRNTPKGLHEKVLAANAMLRAVAESNRITFINLYPQFLDGHGNLDPSLTNDGLHLLGPGYLILRAQLLPYIYICK